MYTYQFLYFEWCTQVDIEKILTDSDIVSVANWIYTWLINIVRIEKSQIILSNSVAAVTNIFYEIFR